MTWKYHNFVIKSYKDIYTIKKKETSGKYYIEHINGGKFYGYTDENIGKFIKKKDWKIIKAGYTICKECGNEVSIS